MLRRALIILTVASSWGVAGEEEVPKHLRRASGTNIVPALPTDVSVYKNVLSEEELAYMMTAPFGNPEWDYHTPVGEPRAFTQSGVAYVSKQQSQFDWLFERLTNLCQRANEENQWGYDILPPNVPPYGDDVQVATYTEGDFYGVHRDTQDPDGSIKQQRARRVCATVLLLNDDYEGGDLHYYLASDKNQTEIVETPAEPTFVKKKAGTAVVWKANALYHGVTELTKGARRVVVWWAHGTEALPRSDDRKDEL